MLALTMAMITGVGGVFLRSPDPKALYEWYRQHLGLENGPAGFVFAPTENQPHPVVSLFSASSKYFPPQQPTMLNFRVDDLDAVLDQLAARGISVDSKRETYEYGRFGWFTDLDGNRVELWQPTES